MNSAHAWAITPDVARLVVEAKAIATTWEKRDLGVRALATALADNAFGVLFFAACFRLTPAAIRQRLPAPGRRRSRRTPMPLSSPLRTALATATRLATRSPLTGHAGRVAVPHLAAALVPAIDDAALALRRPTTAQREALLAAWVGARRGSASAVSGETASPSDGSLRVARHEAGHAVVMVLQGRPPSRVVLLADGDGVGGYAMREASPLESMGICTRATLEARLAELLAGRAAEHLYYGIHAGDSIGAESDLAAATTIARHMVRRWGMSEGVGFVHLDAGGFDQNQAVWHTAMRLILDAAFARATEMLRAHRATIDRIASALLLHNQLTGEDLGALVE